MPYIKKKGRKEINPKLDPLIRKLDTRTAKGQLNSGYVVYVIYKILKDIYGPGNFEIKSNALKILDSAGKEYYRRVMAPYEDRKIKENGDI